MSFCPDLLPLLHVAAFGDKAIFSYYFIKHHVGGFTSPPPSLSLSCKRIRRVIKWRWEQCGVWSLCSPGVSYPLYLPHEDSEHYSITPTSYTNPPDSALMYLFHLETDYCFITPIPSVNPSAPAVREHGATLPVFIETETGAVRPVRDSVEKED